MDLERLFSDDGPLARALPGYRLRPGQLDMARRVAAVLREGGVLLAEAGTGTGKTLAYLAPAVLSGKRVVVSTATKTLQTQILERDIPLLARALDRPVSAVLLKGRQNYLCRRRFEKFRLQGRFGFSPLDEAFHRWAGSTATGDRAELEGLPDDYAPWREVCSTRDTCWGARCPHEAACHFLNQRREAQRAQILVVNHHLFVADLAVRAASSAEVLPRYEAAVFDEAHHLEDVTVHHFGVQVGPHRIADLVRDARAELAPPGGALPAPLEKALAAVQEAADGLWQTLPLPRGEAVRLTTGLEGRAGEALARLLRALEALDERLAPRQAESLEAETLLRRARELHAELARFGEPPLPDEVRWIEPRPRGAVLRAAPVEAAPVLRDALFGQGLPVVLTSATLRVGGEFAYLRARLGVPAGARELQVDSPFDHRAQGLLYVPTGVPDPNSPGFAEAAADEILRILELSRGRAFCLFTSHRVLRIVAERLRGQVPYPLLVQGEQPREVLLRRFQAEVESVLLGALSFWEGVDVPGEALTAVVIDRIPFASPADPVVQARIELVRSRGESPFRAYQLPAAAMVLRQGVGRLLRTTRDRGVVAVLDRRLLERAYGRYLLESLPPFPITRRLSEVARFLGAAGAP